MAGRARSPGLFTVLVVAGQATDSFMDSQPRAVVSAPHLHGRNGRVTLIAERLPLVFAHFAESNAQPAGMAGCPLRKALKTLPAATVVVAISSSQGPGTDMQIGRASGRER